MLKPINVLHICSSYNQWSEKGNSGELQPQHFSFLSNDMYGAKVLHLYLYMQLGRREKVDVVRKKRPWRKLIMNLDGIVLKGVDKESNLQFEALSSIMMSQNLQSAGKELLCDLFFLANCCNIACMCANMPSWSPCYFDHNFGHLFLSILFIIWPS